MSRTYRVEKTTGLKVTKIRFPHTLDECPKHWRKLYMTKPCRRKNSFLCGQVLRGCDPENIVWPLGNRKPHIYYW